MGGRVRQYFVLHAVVLAVCATHMGGWLGGWVSGWVSARGTSALPPPLPANCAAGQPAFAPHPQSTC